MSTFSASAYDFSFLPVFSLDNLMNTNDILKLRLTTLTSNRNNQKKTADYDLIKLDPSTYLPKYEHWLRCSAEFFERAFQLCVKPSQEKISDIVTLCRSFNHFFDVTSPVTYSLKKHLEHWLHRLETKFMLSSQEKELLYTTANPPASILIDHQRYLAKAGDQKAMSFLRNYVYLHDSYSERQVDSYVATNRDLMYIHSRSARKTARTYSTLEWPLLRTLNYLMELDNIDEAILWRIGNHRLPLIRLYTIIDNYLASNYIAYVPAENQINVDAQEAALQGLGL